MNLFELEPEKVYGLKANESNKNEKIQNCINSNCYVASLKYDGQYHRYVSQNGEIKMQTRGISSVTGTYGEMQMKVPHIMKELKQIVPENSMLIGELYRPEWTTNEVGSILRCLPPKAIKRQEETPLFFYIHDVWFFDGENYMIKTKTERNELLVKIEEGCKDLSLDYVHFAKFVDSPEGIKEMLIQAVEEDIEGIVLTLKNGLVSPGARTAWKTLKIKKELSEDADVFLTGNYKAPTKNYTGKEIEKWQYWLNEKTEQKLKGSFYQQFLEGAAVTPITKNYFLGYPASLEIAVLKDDKVFTVGWLSGLSEELKENFINKRELYKNRICKISAMETTEDFKFRHAKFLGFRDDINLEDCNFEKIFNK